jgi:hypothetical protein
MGELVLYICKVLGSYQHQKKKKKKKVWALPGFCGLGTRRELITVPSGEG